MIRAKGKAEKIAYAILGKPANIVEYKKNKNSKKQQQLLFENTRFVR